MSALGISGIRGDETRRLPDRVDDVEITWRYIVVRVIVQVSEAKLAAAGAALDAVVALNISPGCIRIPQADGAKGWSARNREWILGAIEHNAPECRWNCGL